MKILKATSFGIPGVCFRHRTTKFSHPHIPNIDDISGALIRSSLSIVLLNFQCEEDAKDGIDEVNVFPCFCLIVINFNTKSYYNKVLKYQR